MRRDPDSTHHATRPQMRGPSLPDAAVRQAMADLGCDVMQARNHVRCRMLLDVTVRAKLDAARGTAYSSYIATRTGD